MNENFYPELSEAAKLIETFKKSLKQGAEEVIDSLYYDVMTWVESDSWTNMRNQLLYALCDYKTASMHDKSYWKSIRSKILEENYEEIIKDLDQDNLAEIQKLKNTIDAIYKNKY